MGFFWEEGRDPSWEKVSNYNRGQQRSLRNVNKAQQQLSQGGYQDAIGLLQQYLNPQSDVYKNFEQPYLQEFNQQIVPGLAERFAGMGAMGGGLSSSGFGQSLGAAGANLQAQLAQMKQQYQRQSINDLLNQYNQLTSTSLNARPFENVYDPGTEGQLGIGGEILKGVATGAASAFGGPFGKFAGNKLFGAMNPSSNQSQPFSAGSPGSGGGYQGRFGQLPEFGGY